MATKQSVKRTTQNPPPALPPTNGHAETARDTGFDAPSVGTDMVDVATIGGGMSAYRPVDSMTLLEELNSDGDLDLEHAGGSLPPMFDKKAKENTAVACIFLGLEHIDAEHAGGNDPFDVGVFDVIDAKTKKISMRAQLPILKGLESVLGATEERRANPKNKNAPKARDPEKTPLCLITYNGQLSGKDNQRAGLKLYRIDFIYGPVNQKVADVNNIELWNKRDA
jgi:hypothetical protein